MLDLWGLLIRGGEIRGEGRRCERKGGEGGRGGEEEKKEGTEKGEGKGKGHIGTFSHFEPWIALVYQ